MTEVWTLAFLLVTVVSSQALDPSNTTDAAAEQLKQAASVDFSFMENDFEDLKQSYAHSLNASYLNSVGRLALAINQTYEEDIPKNVSGYNLLCLEGIYDDVEDMMGDLNSAVAVCMNNSYSSKIVDENLAQFQIITSSLGEFSRNLTNLLNICSVKFPELSWLQCVLEQLDIISNKFNPIFNQFKIFNMDMNGHLMLLGVEMSRCHQAALQKLAEINKAIVSDLEFCKQ